jgi:NADH-quinone oxidoreductase subunit N
MTIPAFQSSMILAILPELALVVLAGIIMILDVLYRDRDQNFLGWVTAGGLMAIALLAAIFSLPQIEGAPVMVFGGMLRLDWATFVFRLLFLLGGGLTALFATDHPSKKYGEFCALMVLAVLGMNLMAASSNLVMLYLAIEMTSLPLYILAGSRVLDQKSVEAGIKYLLYGAMTSAIMLYGFSLLFGFTGTTNLYEIAQKAQNGDVSKVLLGGIAMLVFVGFGFKISAVPFHFWAPDVYEGAPTPVAGFLSTASKAAGFAVLVRVTLILFPTVVPFWTLAIAMLATASMVIGNFMALAQRNIKRLLAYSSIAQAGYILIGVVANSKLGATGMVYYLASYLVTNLAAFGIVSLVGREVGSDDLDAYVGLGKRNPGVALAMLIALLSLAGIPPLSGFFGKLLVFTAAVQSGYIWLAFVGVITSIVGLFYYLTVMKALYKPGLDEKSLPLPGSWRVALLVCVIGMVALGTIFAPMYQLSVAATSAWF